MTKYQRIIDDIKSRIENGIWQDGFPLPSELELCSMYGVSRITIRRALDELAGIRYVTKIRGKGTFASIPMHLHSGNSSLGFSEYLKQIGIEVVSRLIADEETEASANVCRELLLKDGEKNVWHFRRVRVVHGIPMAVMDTYVRKDTAELMHSYNLEKESFFYLYKCIYGKDIRKNICSISALIPDKEITSLLKMHEPSAGILFESTAYLNDTIPVQYDISVFNPSYYKFTVTDNVNITPISL